MSRHSLAILTGLIVAVSAVNDTVFMYHYPNYFEDAMKLSVNTSLNVGHGMLFRYETDDMVIANETHAVALGEWSNSTREKRFDFTSAGIGLAGYYYFVGHQEVQNIMVGCRGLRWGEVCLSIACLPQLIKFSMGNILFFGLAGKANDLWTALSQYKVSILRSGIINDDETKRDENRGELPPLSDLGYNLPKEYLDIYRWVESTMTK